MKKVYRRVLSMALAVAVSGLCGLGFTGRSVQANSVKLNIGIWDSNQEPGLRKIIDKYASEKGIDYEISIVDWNNYWTKMESAAAGGQLPDVFWMHSNESQRYMAAGLLLPMNQRIEEKGIDLSKYPGDILKLYEYEGEQYALPKDIDTIALAYNKKLFDEKGIAYPDETWDYAKFEEVANALTDKEKGIYGFFSAPSNNQAGYYNAIYSAGGFVCDRETKKSGFDDPKTVEAMDVFVRLAQTAMPSLAEMAETGDQNLMTSGHLAMCFHGSWVVPAFKDNEYARENLAYAVLPKWGDKRVSIFNGLGWSVFAKTEHPDEAFDLVAYLTGKEAQIEQAKLGVTMSAYEGTSDDWASSSEYFDLTPFLKMREDMEIRPYSKNTVRWENRSFELLQDAWSGERSTEEVCKQIAEEMNSILAEE
ncbi:MAG: sugar ABC transporter substrate-binding protein [Eubacteriales bacterium]|nr:sugar ABC transporter substrate-binding protein [Eubacteriales bacterium]